MLTQDLIDYYKGLLILQYAAQPNALGTVDAFIKALVQDQILSAFRDAWDLTTAVGAQLNVLAAYRGLARVVFGYIAQPDWALVPYGDAAPGSYLGWAFYGDASPTWQWMDYADASNVAYSLTDSQLRKLIQLKAAIQSSPLGLGDLDNILYTYFGSYVNAVDNKNMSLTYNHTHADPDPEGIWGLAVLAGVIPHPAGVSFTTVEV